MKTGLKSIEPRFALHAVVAAYSLIHLILAIALPLTAYEAHYALYALDLQWSYLDHPPLVAWLQSLVVSVSSSDFAMRLMPIGLSVFAQYLLAHLSRVVYPGGSRWLPFLSVVVLQGTLVFHGSMTMSPDVPLIPLGLLVVLATVRCLERDGWRDWLLLGLIIGLAGLAKYTAVTLVVSVLAILLIRRGPAALLSPRLWLAGGIALLVISPVLWWNWQNDWMTIRFHSDYQFEDVERWSGLDFLRSSVEQVLYYSPVLVFGGVVALWRALQPPLDTQARPFLIPVFVLPALLVYLAAALGSRASPHWSMLGWILLIPMLVHYLIECWRFSKALRLLTWSSVAYSVAILLAIPLIAVPMGSWPEFQHPVRAVVGWEAATRHGDSLRRALDTSGRSTEPVLLARNWHHGRLLAWYAPDVAVQNLFHDLNPHNVRHGYSDHNSWGVLVYPRNAHEPRGDNLTRDFDCQPIDALPVYFGGSLLQVFHYYRCYSKLSPWAGTDQNASPTPK